MGNTLNISTSHPSNYRLVFPFLPFLGNNEKAESILLYLREVTLPEVELEITEVPTQYIEFKEPSNKLNYGTLDITFSVSELYENYKFIYNWIMAIKDPEVFNIKKHSVQASLHILSNMKNPKLEIELYDLYPTSLSSIELKYTLEDADDLVANASFAFNYFKVN